jgi:2-oxoglutarate dehydrogenase E2 component (dihydrolipoamide succinyltransferase)
MGESIVEGTLTKWLKKPGDKVERDEPLFEISTDKVDTEIPSPVSGVLAEVLAKEGDVVAIKTVVAKINEGGSAAPAAPAAAPAPPKEEAPKQEAQPAAPVPPPPPAPAAAAPPPPPPPPPSAPAPPPQAAVDADEVTGPLSPLVRKMAREYNIDLSQVRGTGAGGRITKQDLEAYMAAQGARTMAAPAAPPVPAAPAPAASAPAAPPAKPAEAPAPVAKPAPAQQRVEPMSIMRQKIAEHMVMSKRTSPHVTTVHRVDMTRVAKLRDRYKNEFKERYGFSLTFLPFVVSAAADALRTFPIVNASIEGTNIIYHGNINIGIAVALDGGLIVPVIKNADEKNITGLARSIADLAARARSKQLKPDEVSGGTFSITNFGSFGSLFATPVINQPQVAILGVGSVTKEPVVVNDAIAIRSMMYLALTFDHRLIDGALGDQFCQKVKEVLENWPDQVL